MCAQDIIRYCEWTMLLELTKKLHKYIVKQYYFYILKIKLILIIFYEKFFEEFFSSILNLKNKSMIYCI